MASTAYLAAGVTATGVVNVVATCASNGPTTFQASGTTTAGAGSAVVAIEVSNDNANWLTLGTITLTLGTSSTSDGFAALAAWGFVRCNVTTLTGTGASVSITMGT